MPTGVYKRTTKILKALKGRTPWNKGNVRLYPLICETCKTKFYNKRKIQRFCSRKCSPVSGHFTKGHKRAGAITNWKGENASYSAKHHWITRHRGNPNYCEHCKRSDLSHRSYQWANKGHTYKRKLDDWIRLCVHCHCKFDSNNTIKL